VECSFRKIRKEELREEELKKNEDAILKFVNIPSDASSPNGMHEVSSGGSANTSKSIPEVEEETTPGQIRNIEEADVESNISKTYSTEVVNDDIQGHRNGGALRGHCPTAL